MSKFLDGIWDARLTVGDANPLRDEKRDLGVGIRCRDTDDFEWVLADVCTDVENWTPQRQREFALELVRRWNKGARERRSGGDRRGEGRS